MIKTLNLIASTETSVSNLGGDRCRIQNRTSGTLYVSDKPGIAPCADGVMSIPPGRGDYFPYSMTSDTVYLLSESGGNVEVSGEHYYRPFDSAAVTGGKAVGNPVVMDGLQGGVPFSEITIDGKNIFDGSLTVGMVATANGTIVASKKYISTTNLIFVKPNTRYIAQNSENKTLDAVVYFDKNKSVIGHTYTSAAGFNSFTTPDKCSFIMWRYLFDTDQDDTSALTNIQLEEGGAITSYELPITGRELTLNVNGTEYKITPDSNPYTVPADIRQLEGKNTLYIADSGARLSVRYSKANAELKRIWDKLDELTTAIVVSSGE